MLPQWAVHTVFELQLAAVGMGTYLGDEDDATDLLQEKALIDLLTLGCNVIDCAPNYRDGRAELSVGRALSNAFASGIAARDEVFVATKVGLLTEDSPLAQKFVLGPEGSCYEPACVLSSLENSLRQLQLSCVDCVFIHNLELLKLADAEFFTKRFEALAECLEQAVATGLCAAWGISSWSGFRVDGSHTDYLSLKDLRSAQWPHLRYIQLPLGLWGSEAITEVWQDGKTILEVAEDMGIFANSPLLQGELVSILKQNKISVENAVRFVRDTPGIDVVLLGIKQSSHVQSWKKIQLAKPLSVIQTFGTTLELK
jgi:aryl-alcohol dehydrogenase-like predicted oxidoreductase